ncbi:alpha/beta hydrolase [Hyphococcus sp.]|uniref:alpha/beta hydrolase n=1 Tax=Hyphococcus sp. TaxID=2038636 RepID=UPI003CCBD72E
MLSVILKAGFVISLLSVWACSGEKSSRLTSDAAKPGLSKTIETTAADGLTIYGETYFGGLDASAPLILLFHQGGSNGRGEYTQIASWLNKNGFRAIAWDLRSGGETYGESNRTAAGLPAGSAPGYCAVAPDLQAAIDYVTANGLGESAILWGSSYSAALVFGAAAANPERTAGVIAFSPSSGGPLENCRARQWINHIDAPVFVLRPASEMDRDSSIEQRNILTASRAKFLVVENGVHGSSMLLDERTQHDMSAARAAVLSWLEAATEK